MADDAPAPKPDDKDIKEVKEEIKEVASEIANTPEEDKDKEWREELRSTLASLKEAVTNLSKQQGESAEVTALRQQVAELITEVRTSREQVQSSSVDAVDPPSPVTVKETSSETAKEPEPEVKQERKPNQTKEPRKKAWV